MGVVDNLTRIRADAEKRAQSEEIGGVREWFDIAYLLREIDRRDEIIEQSDDAAIREAQAAVLEEVASGVSWFGAQGNLVYPDNAWAGISACIKVMREKAEELRGKNE